jgi:hypothetical protein
MATKRKKLAVLMLSTAFMKGHSKAGKPTEFKAKLLAGTKLHTIRGNFEWWQRKAQQINAGEMELSIRQWSGKPYNSQQVEVARLSHLEVQRFEAAYGSTDPQPRVWIDGCEVENVEQVAHNDGLELAEWQEWFFKHTNHFEGVVLQFTSFKY